jgi:hypothetical protein
MSRPCTDWPITRVSRIVGAGTVVVVDVEVVGATVVVDVEVDVDVLGAVVAGGAVVAIGAMASVDVDVGAVVGAAPCEEHAQTSCDATRSAAHRHRGVSVNLINSA